MFTSDACKAYRIFTAIFGRDGYLDLVLRANAANRMLFHGRSKGFLFEFRSIFAGIPRLFEFTFLSAHGFFSRYLDAAGSSILSRLAKSNKTNEAGAPSIRIPHVSPRGTISGTINFASVGMSPAFVCCMRMKSPSLNR
jgi:hypothetical protein